MDILMLRSSPMKSCYMRQFKDIMVDLIGVGERALTHHKASNGLLHPRTITCKMFCLLTANNKGGFMKHVLFIVFFLIILHQSAFAENEYEKLLFPDGLPYLIVDGEKQEAEFKILSKKSVLRNGLVVLYSTIQASGLASEKLFAVYLALLETRANNPYVISTTNITNHLKTYIELPGTFQRMDALLELFEISDDMQGIHINLWSIISGSGSHSSATDLFYLIDSNFKLQMVFKLLKSNHFSKQAHDIFKSKNSFIFHGDINDDNFSEIVVLEANYTASRTNTIKSLSFSPDVKVYKFNGKSYSFFKTIDVFSEKYNL